MNGKSLCEHCKHQLWTVNARWNPYFNTITAEYTHFCGAPGAPEGKIEQPVTECSDYKPTESAK